MSVLAPHRPVRHDHTGPCSCAVPSELAMLADIGRLAPTGRRPTWARPPAPGVTAELLIVGDLRTMNPAQPTAEAIAVRDGFIVGIGTRDEVDGLVDPSTRTIDLGGGVGLPGFVDPHMHYWGSALLMGWVVCAPRDGLTYEEILDRLRAAGPTAQDWTLGQLYDPSLIADHRELTRDVLDELVPDRPVLVMNASMHYAYVNSAALARAGIDEAAADPPGGFFGRDEHGRLNGALGELGAMGRVLRVVPRKSQAELVDAIVAINRRAAAVGITRTHDAGSGTMFGGTTAATRTTPTTSWRRGSISPPGGAGR